MFGHTKIFLFIFNEIKNIYNNKNRFSIHICQESKLCIRITSHCYYIYALFKAESIGYAFKYINQNIQMQYARSM